MRGYYGIMVGLAMSVALANGALAQTATPAKGSILAGVKTAHVVTATTTFMPGLSASTKRVEDYFNDIASLQADFTQTVTGDTQPSTGTFYWRKPGKFLWLYKAPTAQKIVSTGSAIYFIDDRQQATQLPMDAGVARLFNAKKLNLSQQGLRATDTKENGRMLSVTFAVEKKIAAGENSGLAKLTLTFTKLAGGRMYLSQMDAVDTLSTTTRVEFRNVSENVTLVNKLFEYTPGVYDQRN
jgi:outer membrane lipoprotein-sorting protein